MKLKDRKNNGKKFKGVVVFCSKLDKTTLKENKKKPKTSKRRSKNETNIKT